MKWYVGILLAILVLSGGGLVMIALNTDPFTVTWLTKALFFISFFMFFWSLASVVAAIIDALRAMRGQGFWARLMSSDQRPITLSFRRGFYCAVIATLIVALRRNDMANLATVIIPLVAVIVLEIVLNRREAKKGMYQDFS